MMLEQFDAINGDENGEGEKAGAEKNFFEWHGKTLPKMKDEITSGGCEPMPLFLLPVS
jgi:hypothetical protein